VWAKLPPGQNATNVLQKSVNHKVKFAPGKIASQKQETDNFIRFCFVHWNLSQIEEGIKRLANAIGVD